MRLFVAVPLIVFALAFGASFAYHSLADAGEPRADAASSAGDGRGRIAVSVRGAGTGDSYLWTVSLDGSDPVQLTRPSAGTSLNDGYTSWSPDGRTIVLVRQSFESGGQPTPPRLFAISPDGTGLRQLTRGNAIDFLPAWWPDGSRIVFSRVTGEASDLFAMDADGRNVVQLTDEPRVHEDMASVSPDGKRIVYTRVDETTEDLYVMNADGSGKTPLLRGPHQDGTPDWSPDGSRIAFVRDGHVAVMSSDGTGIRLLTRGELKDSGPQWSHEGTSLLFTRDPGEIYVMNADGSGLARVPIEGQAGGASWGPPK
jgi:Tol biopolymer transport system component